LTWLIDYLNLYSTSLYYVRYISRILPPNVRFTFLRENNIAYLHILLLRAEKYATRIQYKVFQVFEIQSCETTAKK